MMTKLLLELCFCVSREQTNDLWELDKMMEIFERELDARERSTGVDNIGKPMKGTLKSFAHALQLYLYTESL